MTTSRTYLVTGAAGFIGSQFVRSCNEKKISVISVDHLPHFATRTEHQGIDYGTRIDREELQQWLQSHKVDTVVHLGACANTMEMDQDYLRRMNLEYSQMLWKYSTERKIPFVYASSAATYGDGELGYQDDESQMGSLVPLNPYGESKLKFDLWALEQEKAGLHPPTWSGFKFFNVYGFGERHKGPMASVVLHAYDQIKKTGEVKLFKSHRKGIADGHQKRDFIHVHDVEATLHFAIQKPIRRGIFNLGTGRARTFLDLVRAVFLSLGLPEKIRWIDTPEAIRERYQYFTQAEMAKLRHEGQDASAFLSLEDGVQRTLAQLIQCP